MRQYSNASSEQLKSYSQDDIFNFLGEEYIQDGEKIDENGNIVYLNDGYPILKWQRVLDIKE